MFENYVGQNHIKTVLSGLVSYHKTSNEPLQHMLITGPSGTGKTKLANEIAGVMNVNCISLLATNTSEEDLIKAICSLHDRDLLVIDELQSLKKKLVEILFPIMTDRILYVNYNGYMQKFQVNNFTIIGATDRAGLLNPALLNRFQLQLNLKPYTRNDLIQLIKLNTKGYIISDIMCNNIAMLCKDVPRILLNIISSIKIYLNSIHKVELEECDLIAIRDFLGINELGLDTMDLIMLKYLNDNKSASVQTLASVCGCLPTNIENLHEPYLIKLGFISKSSSGRTITEKGIAYCNKEK